ncbi:MAG: hypothetical protein ACFB21_05580 [Opitutales bacterium]
MNRAARRKMTATCELDVVAGASHLFEEPGTLDKAARGAGKWFRQHLSS